MLRTISKKL